ncbi:hypothetical protein PsYK624_048210 [Phanerochaete sordida]|uniref:Uncharacterized protein n=1 Tax=Phanerochaete sordida TaxID=48140 RepID=A0A9P3LC31_9APHY|nr:hypothetical protein PsYK624_048210 [Phanerochaete sordida]
MPHERRRSVDSSSSSSSSSDDEREHSKQAGKHQYRDGPPSAAGNARTGAVPHNDNRAAQFGSQPPPYSTAIMSGPGFPSGPLHPYGFENRDFPSMPNAEGDAQFRDQGSFAPPSGPPPSFPSHSPGFPEAQGDAPPFPAHPPGFPDAPHENIHERGFAPPSFPDAQHGGGPTPPGAHARGAPPPSGFRLPLTGGAPFPGAEQTGPPVAYDMDGRSPIFLGSAILPNSVHPCKIAPALSPHCRVPYGGTETEHHDRYDLLPFDPLAMEWVPTSQGRVPPGRRPVEGGYEDHGGKLYHALAQVSGVEVPGKTGEHLGACNVAFGGREVAIKDYKILCWK